MSCKLKHYLQDGANYQARAVFDRFLSKLEVYYE